MRTRCWPRHSLNAVQTGDRVDRGPDSRKSMDLLMRLEKEAKKAGGGPLSVGEPRGDERPGRPAGVYVGEQSWATGRPLRLPSPPARWGSARGYGFGSGRGATSSSGPIAGAYARRRKRYAYGLRSSVFGVLRRHLARHPRLPPGEDSRSPPLARRAATVRHAIRAPFARGCWWPVFRRSAPQPPPSALAGPYRAREVRAGPEERLDARPAPARERYPVEDAALALVGHLALAA